MICLSITEKTTKEAVRACENVPDEVGLVEVRGDYVRDLDLDAILGRCRKPVIATIRRREEGGSFTGSEEERIRLLMRAKRAGAQYIDLEWRTPSEMRDRVVAGPGDAKVVLSFHDFQKTPRDLFSLSREMIQCKADVVKIVCQAQELEDNFRIFRLLKHMKGKMVAHAMGSLGLISRVLSPKFGSLWTYCHRCGAEKAAPGQLVLETMTDVYRCQDVNEYTAVYGLLGNPVVHSCSPHMQNAAFRHYNLNAVYVPMQVTDLTSLLAFFPEMGVRGCSVTIPHKVRIMDHLDSADDLAQRMGAANTIYMKEGKLVGTNTDGMGALRTIQAAGVHLTGANVVILGAGGSARGVGFTLSAARRLRSLAFVTRRVEQAQILARDLSRYTTVPLASYASKEESAREALLDADLIINCTPVGMFPKEDESPIPKDMLRFKPTVFDIVYHPLMTRLLREARDEGCPVLTGLDMLVHQGAAQFEVWTGLKAPFSVMKHAALEALNGFAPGEEI